MYLYFRQADRFYDGDIFIDPAELEREQGGIENNSVIQNHPLRSRDNLYEYRDAPSGKLTKSQQDTQSLRSPSSLGMTHTTRTTTGSQNSLRSAISLKDTAITPTSTIKDSTSFDKSLKYSERSVDTNPKGSSGKYDDSRNLLTTYAKSRDTINSSSMDHKPSSTPVPSSRKNAKTNRTHLIEGIPQTEV